ncbi:ABC transporter permease [Sphaerobacter sp.]|uniref:ABC transporter permease n=1 Tax=Sphaerobacter sp. TaxID=2099654 RepID=UPI001D9B914F|nr:ABC transporter permease [Sphaerobacter sp.]MBX5445997.1 ABC transporter permease [Sphaerobacter sp.]
MLRYTVRRLLGAVPLIIGISLISFLFMQLAPGGPDAMFARSGRMSDEQLAAIRRNMGLDQPVPVQYLHWLKNLLKGDLGTSYVQNRPVTTVILERLPSTLILVGAGLSIALVLALAFGVLAAVRQYSLFDHIVSAISFFGLAMPVFWFGLMLQLLFGVRLGWLPTAGMHATGETGLLDLLKHLALPAFTLAVGTIAGWSRYVRSSLLEVIHKDYIRTARAKGVRERTIFLRHALRNALIPFVTVVGIDIPLYAVGAVVTETVFAWPGMGRLFYDSLASRDYPVQMGILVLSSVAIILGNLIADLIYALLDPRITYD